jgi:DNA-binding transcriptional MerR regulator
VTSLAAEPRDLFAIADLAREFGISTRAIRFYESKGLLAPDRVGGTRIFRRRDRARLMLILRGKRLGFSLRDISNYLDLYDAHSQTAQVELLVGKVDERLDLLETQRADLETTIGELREIRQLAGERLAQGGRQDDASGTGAAG